MNTARAGKRAMRLFALLFCWTVTGAAYANESTDEASAVRTFEILKKTLPKIKFENQEFWFAEGDMRLTESELRLYAKSRLEQLNRYNSEKGRSTVREVNLMPRLLIQRNPLTGGLIRWAPGQNLTYCVLRASFPTQAEYDSVVNQIREATEDWKETCNIGFAHVRAADNLTPGPTPPAGVLFTVRKFPLTGGVIASAFFPQEGPERRHVLIGPAYFTTSFNRVGVLRHELGHVLGFRHEHIRSEAPAACFTGEMPDGNTVPLTDYNPTSVMHYFCGGVGDINLAISSLDRLGARMVYPFTPSATGLDEPVVVNAADVMDAVNLKFENVQATVGAEK
jgi:hypothetical protein